MPDAATTHECNSDVARLAWDVVDRRCRELGCADNDFARAQLLGVTRNTVLRWRRGHTGVTLATAVRVARVLSVQLEQLLADTTRPGTPPPSPPPPQPPRPAGPGREAD